MTPRIETVTESVANKTTLGGAITGLFGYVSSINWIGLIGVLVAVGGFAVSFWFQWRRDKREGELHRAQLAAIERRRSDG